MRVRSKAGVRVRSKAGVRARARGARGAARGRLPGALHHDHAGPRGRPRSQPLEHRLRAPGR